MDILDRYIEDYFNNSSLSDNWTIMIFSVSMWIKMLALFNIETRWIYEEVIIPKGYIG